MLVLRSLHRLAILLLLGSAAPLFAQAAETGQSNHPCSALHLEPDKAFAFDVAAIKPSDPARTITSVAANTNGRWEQQGATLSGLIEDAYGVASYQVEGLPKSLENRRFDIQAKTLSASGGGPVPKYDGVGDAKRLRALLLERFGLKLSCRSGEHKTAILTRDPKHSTPPVSPGTPADERWREGPGSLSGKHVLFHQVVREASFALQEKVEDDTGIGANAYDLDMHWTPMGEDTNAPDAVTFEQALYNVFGVKIQHEPRPIAILVVEQAHMPEFD